MGWEDDPELVATFRSEVEERLESLCAGLLQLESSSAPRQLVSALFRDAHTVKGSARMLGLDEVVGMAHRAEDLLGALRDGRMTVRTEHVDVLLTASEAIARSLPGSARPLDDDDAERVIAALDAALAGEEALSVPRLGGLSENVHEEEDAFEPTGRGRVGDFVRVPARRVHDLLDVVGEAELDLRLVQRRIGDMASTLTTQIEAVRRLRDLASMVEMHPDVAAQIHRITAANDQSSAALRELRTRLDDSTRHLVGVREGAMSLAMVPLGRIATGFPQLVREVAAATGKDVRLVVTGEDVELDTRVLEGVADAMRHLVTNAVDHGCELPEVRIASGKPARATVRVSARAAGSSVVVEVADDGAGIDEAAIRTRAIELGLLPEDSNAVGSLLFGAMFVPGFTTRSAVTETSGRGVGLDVVRTAVEGHGGVVEIETERGVGTRFVITLPVTLGVMRCLIARIGSEHFAIPVASVVETLMFTNDAVHSVAGAPVLVRQGVCVPIADLGTAIGITGERSAGAALIVRYGGSGELMAWVVDALESELELVVKSLGDFLGRPPGVVGATLDGDGSVMLLLDARELALGHLATNQPGEVPTRRADASNVRSSAAARVLVVEDSVGVRELQRVILEGAGYDVVTAIDGLDGASRLGGTPFDLVLSDVEMPGMDGFTLTRTLRRTSGWEDVPVVIMTSRGDDADKRAGLDAGASAYLLKSEFDQQELIDTVRRLIGR